MDETPDIASLLYMDEPTAQEKAKALTAALRGQQAQAQQRQFLGALGGLTGSEGIANLGQTFGAGGTQDYQQAAKGLETLQGMPQARLQRALQQQTLTKSEAENAEAAREREALASGTSLESQSRIAAGQRFGLPLQTGAPGNSVSDKVLSLALQAKNAEEQALWRKDEAQSRREAAALARADREAAAAEKAANKNKEDLEKDVQKAGADLSDVAVMKNDLEVLQGAAEQKDIPGIGAWDSRKGDIPLIGSAFQSPADIQTRQSALRVMQNLLHMQSGATVSQQEAANKLEEMGLKKGGSEQEFRIGLQNLIKNTRDAIQAKEAKFRPEVIGTIRERGGKGSADLPKPATMGGAAPSVTRKGKNGKTYRMGADGAWEEVD